MCPDFLFHREGELRDFLEERKQALKKEIDSYDPNYILNVSEEDLCQSLTAKHVLEAPTIHEDKIYVYDTKEIDVDVSRDPRRMIIIERGPVYVKGTQITIAVPFDGDGELFQYKTSTFTYAPPRGEIVGQEIHLIYETVEHNQEELKQTYGQELNEIKRYLEWVKGDVQSFNNSLESFIKQNVTRRKKRLLDDQGLASSLGIPVKRRDSLPQTYAIPTVRKKPKIEIPQVTQESFKPEPTLSEEEYESILEIIYNMSLVMERSPKTFSKLEEEQIRDHFLMILNSHYEGQATGETFNYGGKTDILIRAEGKNVFVAECKFWKGEKELLKTMDQLLGYTSWRDTKTAILLFNKNQDFSSVLNKITPATQSHACHKRVYNLRSSKLKNETTFSYVFHQPNDKNREFILTVMAFDIPKSEQ
jgi:hypothetical protein